MHNYLNLLNSAIKENWEQKALCFFQGEEITFEGLAKHIARFHLYFEKVGIKKTIRAYVPDEADFLARLDEMTEQAFDDQCTGANPRYPLMSEIKQMYLNAYYGKHENV